MEVGMKKIYSLYVNGEFKICHHDLMELAKMKTHVVDCWKSAQVWGFSYWTDRTFPIFEIR